MGDRGSTLYLPGHPGRRRHGHTTHRWTSPTYGAWRSMFDPRRGFGVDPAWRDFAQFLADVGERPAGAVLVRSDQGAAFGPGNGAWAISRPPRTHCRAGHRLTPANSYVRPGGRLECRQCHRARRRARRQARAERRARAEVAARARAERLERLARGADPECRRGHPLTADNRYERADGRIECRACARITRSARDRAYSSYALSA